MKYSDPAKVDDVWGDGEGRPVGTVYEDSLGHRRVATPPTTGAKSTVARGHQAIAVFGADCDEKQARRRAVQRRMSPASLKAYERWLVTRGEHEPPPSSVVNAVARALRSPTRVTGRAPREATNARSRGSRRGQRATSSSSDDPGSDSDSSDSSDSSEPARRRLCAFCNRELTPGKRKYCSALHADRDRQRRKRERDRARALTPKIPTTAADAKMRRFEPGEYERLLSKATCACNGHHLLDAPRDPDLGERCCKCGRQRPESTSGRKLLGQLATLREAARS